VSSRFDEYESSYEAEVERSISFSGKDHDFFTRAKVDAIVAALRRQFEDPGRLAVLDVGCGIGLTDELISPLVASVTGVDVSTALVAEARKRNPGSSYDVYDGAQLPYADGAFDVALAICVVHHVPPGEWAAFAEELRRVIRPGGLAIIAEHNPYNPLTRRVVSRCAFDDDAVLLSRKRAAELLAAAGLQIAERRDILFFPWSGSAFRLVERLLGAVPLGAQYVVAATAA
jgi:SAM-dependent methyltransferase